MTNLSTMLFGEFRRQFMGVPELEEMYHELIRLTHRHFTGSMAYNLAENTTVALIWEASPSERDLLSRALMLYASYNPE